MRSTHRNTPFLYNAPSLTSPGDPADWVRSDIAVEGLDNHYDLFLAHFSPHRHRRVGGTALAGDSSECDARDRRQWRRAA